MMCEELVKLTETFIVAGYADIQQPVAVTKLNPGGRGDVAAAALPHKIGHTGGIVDVSKHQPLNTRSRGELRKALRGEGTVTQAVV
jgi:hypothetical protein